MTELICIGLFLPLLSFLLLVTFQKWCGRSLTGWIACGSILFSFICFLILLVLYLKGEIDHGSLTLFSWIPVNGINADFTLYLDHLSLLMTLVITGVGFLIHVYSIGYMEDDPDYLRYFAFLNFFIFSMLLLVLAKNLLLLFVGWEGVGLASYLLIGFWYQLDSAASAATKAFIVNRIGDVGLLIGILLTLYVFGTSDMIDISNKVSNGMTMGAPLAVILTLLYFCGAVGKSAQLPLHVWLPDAMAGPTPVSALIHAATMVTAGVYLVVRMHTLFSLAPQTLQVIGFIGALTSLLAALWATSQTDLKRVLAYSTVSQLGLMFLATSVGAYYAAMFHLTTHAFVKALLFLSAGNVIHKLHGVTEMDKMGGLYKKFPITHWLFLLGVLALSGVPPLATFFSKDLIIELEHMQGYETYFYVGILISILTAFYLTRAYCLTFLGKESEEKSGHVVQEAPFVMWGPVSVLGLLAIVGGFLGFCFCPMPLLEEFLTPLGITKAEREITLNLLMLPETWFAILATLLGIGLSAWIYTYYRDNFRGYFEVLKKGFYIDEIYDFLFVKPISLLASVIVTQIEPKLIEGSIQKTSYGTEKISAFFQRLQSGQVRSYNAWIILGASFLIGYFIFLRH